LDIKQWLVNFPQHQEQAGKIDFLNNEDLAVEAL
jgi:hypothetical protein